MDLTRSVGYRGFDLNTIRFDATTRDMVGCEVVSIEYGRVVGEGYTEKAAMREGRDSSDVFLDQRLISMTGNVYGRHRAEALDLHRRLSDVLTPSDAYEADPGQKGYEPLDFWSPTEDTNFADGLIHQIMLARPLATPSARFDSDRHGGEDSQGLAIPWQAQLSCRNPRILSMGFNTVNMTGAASGSGTVRNKGNRPAVIEVYLIIPNNINGGSAGRLELWIEGAFRLWITLPHSDADRVLQYDSDLKVAEYSNQLRMNYLDFRSDTTHHNLGPGQHSYTWKVVGNKNLRAGSYFRFRDTWA